MTKTEMYLKDGTLLQGGKYRIVRFISSGGFGCTYEAEHVMLERKVALKEFFVSDYCNRNPLTGEISLATEAKAELLEKLRRKFLEEAQAVSNMDHPHIVGVSDVFEENGTAYYAMDFIEGQSLADMVKHHGSLPEAEAVGYIKQVADALEYVHSLNRLHLDIKPGNIMVDKDGKAILIDFGTSKQYDEANGENTSTLMGRTPGYAPPEQMDNSVGHFYPSTDIYALGATLYKLLTGITPPSANQLLAGNDIVPLPADISQPTRKAVTTSMRLRKDERPQSIKEFLNILDSPLEESETIVDKPVTVVAETPRKKSKTPAIVAAVIAAVCLAAIVVGIVLSRHHKPTAEEVVAADTALTETCTAETQESDETNIAPQSPAQVADSNPTESSEIEKLRIRAEQGDANSQYALGVLCDEGNGVAKDPAEAMRWYWKAAAQGHGQAQYNLGACYEYGEGTTQNFTEAARWYRKAAEQGLDLAQYDLGVCYYNGKGVSQSYEEAVNWFKKSAEQDNADAQYNLGICYYHGQGVKQDYWEAVKWWTKAAGQGHANAQYNLGICYSHGQGVEQDYGEAVKWWTKAAGQGHTIALYNLGCCYHDGNGVAQSAVEAVKWWTKAALLGYAEAQYNLGLCYGNGDGVEKSYEEAVKWLRKAATQGHTEAKQTLEELGERTTSD